MAEKPAKQPTEPPKTPDVKKIEDKPTSEVKKENKETSKEVAGEEKKKVSDAQEKFQQKKSKLEEKKKSETEKRDFLGKYKYESNADNPPPIPGSEDAGVEEHYFGDEKRDRETSEKEAVQALKEKHDAEMESVKETKSLEGLDKDTKKAVHVEIIRQTLNPEEIPTNFLEEAQKSLYKDKRENLSDEEKIRVKDLAIEKQAQKMQEEYEKALLEDSKKNPPGSTAGDMLKTFKEGVQDALTLKVFEKGDDIKISEVMNESAVEVAERILAEKNLSEYISAFGEGYDIKKIPPEIKKIILMNPNFRPPESIKGTIDSFKLAVTNGELPFVERSDFPEGPEGDKAYEEATKKVIEDNTGLNTGDLNNAAEKLRKNPNFLSGDHSKLHPFLRLIADLLSGIGVALEEAGLLKGDFWRNYVGEKNAQGSNTDYLNNGVSSPGFEVDKTTSGEELIGSAEKYLGKPYSMGGQGRLNIPGDPIDCSQLVVNSLKDLGCLPAGFDTTASGFAQRSELAGQNDGKPGDLLIRTEGGSDHIAIITGGPDNQGNYTTIEATSANSAGSGVIKTTRKASPDGERNGFKVYKNPFLTENKPERNTEKIPEGGEEKKIVPTHYWHEKKYDSQVDKWTAKGGTKSEISLFDKSGNPITPETHGYGFCAVDPNIIPFGSLIIANGKKYYAIDQGGDVIKGVAAKERGLGQLPVIDFYSKHPVGPEGKGLSMDIRVLPPNKSDRSLADLKKGYTPGNIPEIDQKLVGNAKGIVSTALDACRRGDIMGSLHCTDWVDKVYKKTTGTSVYNAPLRFNGVRSINRGTGIGVGSYASEGQIGGIVAGQHLIVDKPSNGNYGVGRTHSVIALGTPVNGVVEVVSYPNNKIPPKVEKYDLYGRGKYRGVKDGKVLRIQGG